MYIAKKFHIPELQGMSQKNIAEHMMLYEGYVTNTNMILEKLNDESIPPYARSEMQRRLSFEWNGMKNHEFYFQNLEGGSKNLDMESMLGKKINESFGSFDNWKKSFIDTAKTRGVGWAILWYDQDNNILFHGWTDEQHLGHMNSIEYILGIDMWEHAYVGDYWSSGKGKYIEDFLANINWGPSEERFEKKLRNQQSQKQNM